MSPNQPVRMVPAASLLEDMDLYPRHAVDEQHVAALARSLAAEDEDPERPKDLHELPIIADQRSKRITDGWHRRRAWLRVYGPEVKVPVVLRRYADEAEMLEDAIRRNGAHGRRLDRQDEVRCAVLAEGFGLTPVRLAVALRVTPVRIERLRQRVVITPAGTRPAKTVSRHLWGHTVTEEQAAADRSFSGVGMLQAVAQLRKAVEAKLFDATDPRVLHALHGLAQVIHEHVPEATEGAE